jgi:hypothetical protein
MKSLFLVLFFAVSAIAEEPVIPGDIIATVDLAFEDGLDVTWDNIPAERPCPGSILSIEWGDGQYFAKVIAVHGHVILVDYFPTSTSVTQGAIVRLFDGSTRSDCHNLRKHSRRFGK